MFESADDSDRRHASRRASCSIVGVNGTGKTTTVGKLANLLKKRRPPAAHLCGRYVPRRGRRAARDLGEPGGRRHGAGARGRRSGGGGVRRHLLGEGQGRDPVLVDTAGRLHTRVNLMNELDKIRRVAAREVPGAPQEVLLVLDATVGQNGAGAGARVHERRRRQRHRADEARWHGQGRRRGRDRARSEAADPLRRRRRGASTTSCRSRREEYVDGLFEEKW